MVWSFAVVDYGLSKDGSPVIYELQPFITLMPHQDRIQNMWSVLGADSDYGVEHQNKNFQTLFKALGLENKGSLVFHNEPEMLLNKRLQRQWLNSNEKLKVFNPPFITFDFLRPLTSHLTELYRLYDETKKVSNEDEPTFVIKLPCSTRGEGNYFFNAPSKEQFVDCLSVAIAKGSYKEVDHLGRLKKTSLECYPGQVVIEGCVNAHKENTQAKETHRLLIAIDEGKVHLLPTTRWEHLTYDSHKKIKQVDHITGIEYDFINNNAKTVSHVQSAQHISDCVRKGFELVAHQLSDYLNSSSVLKTAHVSYIKEASYDFTIKPVVRVDSITGDMMGAIRLLQGAVYPKVKPKLIGKGGVEKELRIAALVGVEAYNNRLAELLLSQLGQLYFPIDESHWYQSESLSHFLRHINHKEKKGDKSIERVLDIKRRLLECEHGVKGARQHLPLQLTPDILVKTSINISLRRAINQLREGAHGYHYREAALVTELHSVPMFTVHASHHDEGIEKALVKIEKMLAVEAKPENHFYEIISKLKSIEQTLIHKYKISSSTYLLQAVALISNQLSIHATTKNWVGQYVVNQLEQHVWDVELVLSVTKTGGDKPDTLPNKVAGDNKLTVYRDHLYELEWILYPELKKLRSWASSHHPRFTQLANSLEDIRLCLVSLGISCLTRAELHQHFLVSVSQPELLYKEGSKQFSLMKNR